MYTLIDLIPAIYILTFVLIVFASLTFKVRRVNSKEYENLRESLLDNE